MSREQVKNEKGTKRLVVSASAYVFDEVLSLRTQGTKSRDYKGDDPHASSRRGPPGWPKVVTGTGSL